MADVSVTNPSAIASPTLDNQRFADLGVRNRILEDGRVPFVLTCLSWQAQGRYIYFWANPSDLSFNFKLRGTTQEVLGGTMSYQWRGNPATRGGLGFFAEPRLAITFQTGNLMPVRTSQNGDLIAIPPGLLDFYEFLQLMNEPMILDNGSMNYRILSVNTSLFPNLLCYGFFPPDEAFEIRESAQDPNQTTWTSNFVIRRTSPDFKNPQALAYAFRAFSLGANEQPRFQSTVGQPDAPLSVRSPQDDLEGTDQARMSGLLPTPEQSDQTINLNLGLNGVGNQNTRTATR